METDTNDPTNVSPEPAVGQRWEEKPGWGMPWPLIDIVEASDSRVVYRKAGSLFTIDSTPVTVARNYVLVASDAQPGPTPVTVPAPIPCLACRAGDGRHITACAVRIQRHQIAEGGSNATASAPVPVRDSFADLVDEYDLLPSVGG